MFELYGCVDVAVIHSLRGRQRDARKGVSLSPVQWVLLGLYR